MQDKNHAISAAVLRKQSYFVQKVSSRLPGLECSYENIFIPVYPDLGNRAIPASQINTSKFLRWKEWRAQARAASPRARNRAAKPPVDA